MKILLNLVLSVLLVSATAVHASDLKIGYVNVEVLLREAPQVDQINVKMLERFGDKKTDLENLEKEIKGLQENYKRNELVMTDDKLEEIKQNIISKVQVFKQYEAMLQQEVATMRSQEVAVLQEAIRGVIADIAKNKKYDLIISDGVLHANEKLNITESVLEKMRALIKK